MDVWHVSTSCLQVGYMLNLNQLYQFNLKVETYYYHNMQITRARVGTHAYLTVDSTNRQSHDLLTVILFRNMPIICS